MVSLVSNRIHVFQSHTRWRAGHPRIWGGPSGQELASLCGGWRSKAAEETLSVSFPFRREQSSSSQETPSGFWQCGVCLMTGMEDYCRRGVLSGRDSEHRIKDGRKAKRSLGPVPCLSLSLPRQMVVILHLKISRAASHRALGSVCFPLTIKKFFLMFWWKHFQRSTCPFILVWSWRWGGILCVIIALPKPGNGDPVTSWPSLLGAKSSFSIQLIIFFLLLSGPFPVSPNES